MQSAPHSRAPADWAVLRNARPIWAPADWAALRSDRSLQTPAASVDSISVARSRAVVVWGAWRQNEIGVTEFAGMSGFEKKAQFHGGMSGFERRWKKTSSVTPHFWCVQMIAGKILEICRLFHVFTLDTTSIKPIRFSSWSPYDDEPLVFFPPLKNLRVENELCRWPICVFVSIFWAPKK
jgi:hypothetical protein